MPITDLKLFNSITRTIEPVEPIVEGVIGMYACGPTVYDNQHIGNMRTFIMVDTLRRVVQSHNLKVNLVVNITDVGHLTHDQDEGEDKMQKGAQRENKTAWEIAKRYEEQFLADIDELNIQRPTHLPRATDHIQEMIDYIQILETKGYTYRITDGIYFNTGQDPDYGKSLNVNIEGQLAGARIEINPEKKHPADFALWKFSPMNESRDMEWESPWGKGFPGWHIECSVMSVKYLGQPFDIHCGGIDHIPVHHTNEIAQTMAATGKKLSNMFVHFEHLLVDNHKMAKSDGSFITVSDIIDKGFQPRALRYLCLMSHYQDKLNFTWESLEAAQTSLYRLDRLVASEGREDRVAVEEAIKIISNNLATPRLLAFLELNKNPWLWKELESLHGLSLGKTGKSVVLTEEQNILIAQRNKLRSQGDYQEADKIRDQLLAQGVVVEDSSSDI